MTTQATELTRHFFWRFFENDLVSPDADVHESAAFLLAFLVAPCVLDVPGLAFNYGNTFTPPLERIEMIILSEFGYVSWSMLVAALVAILVWDGLTLDARDYAILGPLPIAPRSMLGAKLRATGVFLVALLVSVNGVSAIAFPLLAPGPNGTLGAVVSLILGHTVATIAAGLFGFFAVLTIRGLFVNLLGARLFARLGVGLQFLIALGCVIAYLSVSITPLEQSGTTGYFSPPLWFLGLYQSLSPRVVAGIPVAHERLFGELATWAILAVCAAAAAGVALYFAAYFRFARHKPQPYASRARTIARALSVAGLTARFLLRDPLKRATFLFTTQTVGRSARHRLYVAGYLLAGCVLCYLTVVTFASERRLVPLRTPSPQLLAVQSILVLALLAGVRAALATPAELKAAWVFRLTAGGELNTQRYLGGVRQAVFTCFAIPLLAALMPLQAMLWGGRYAVLHFAFGSVWALILTEALLLRLAKLPFTCARVPGSSRLLFRWPVYVVGIIVYAYGFGRLEYAAIAAGDARVLLAGVVLAYAALVAYRHLRAHRLRSFVFDEAPDGATTLGL